MKLFSSVLLLVAVECLFAKYASSKCQALNRTLFRSCVQAGYNVSSFNRLNSSRQQNELANTITSMQRKLNCSQLSAPMTCSVYLPKCSTPSSPRLPCKNSCRNFVSGCQFFSRAESEGLRSLFSGLCELLLTDSCSRHVNNTGANKVTCHNLTVKQCAGAGYNLTSVSSAYQKMVEASDVFQNIEVNSTLRKIICMEIAPPCVSNYSGPLLVPCKPTCEDAFKNSEMQFKKIFNSSDYCSAFPVNDSGGEQDHCMLQEWPSTGYWPSDLWKSIGTFTATETSTTTQATKSTTGSSSPTTKPPSQNITSLPVTITSENVISTVPTSKASGNDSTTTVPTSGTTGNVSAPSPKTRTSTNVSIPVATTQPFTNRSTARTTTHAVDSPVPTTEPTVNSTTPVPNNRSSVNSSSTVQTTRASVIGSSPVPTIQASTIVSIPVSSTRSSVNSSSTVAMTQASAANSSTLVSTSESAVKGSMSLPATSAVNGTTPTPRTRAPVTRSSPVPKTSASIKSTTPMITAASEKSTTPSTTRAPITRSSLVPKTSASIKSTTPMIAATSEKSTAPSRSKGSPKVHASTSGKLSAGVIAGIVMGVIAGLVLIILGVIFFRRRKRLKIQFRHSLMVNMDEL